MEWYFPITILPGLSMLVMSTTNQMLSISTEVGSLLMHSDGKKCKKEIIDLKIIQIRRLTYSTTLQYIACGTYVLSGIILAMEPQYKDFSLFLLIFGTGCVFLSLILLSVYAFKTITIRQKQFKDRHR